MLNHERLQQHKWRNRLQSLLLLAAMAALLIVLGYLLAGNIGIFISLFAFALLLLLNPRLSPALLLRMYQARRVTQREAPWLVQALQGLAQRAGLENPPHLYLIPSRVINAFAVKHRHHSALAVTHGLLNSLNERELIGVLAHEMSHISHNDMWVMGVADLFSRLTSILSLFGQLLLIINLPLLLFGQVTISWLAILILVFAPSLSALMQLALSRTREFEADLGAAHISGDPQGLASALNKLERSQGNWLEQLFMPGRRDTQPSLLRTHPPTEERIKRLLSLAPPSRPAMPAQLDSLVRPAHLPPQRQRPPRWHIGGLWY